MPRCHQQMNGQRRHGTMEYHPAIKRMALSQLMWMNLEPVIKSEISQKKKNKYPMLLHICGI